LGAELSVRHLRAAVPRPFFFTRPCNNPTKLTEAEVFLMKKPAEKLTEKDIDDMFEGSITQSLIASIKLPKDFDYKEVLAEALMEKYL
jgi:hypothetical protein